MVSWDWGPLVTDEESFAHPDVCLVVFHYRRRFPVAGVKSVAAGAKSGLGAGAIGRSGGVFAFWLDVLAFGVKLLF